MVVGNEKGMLLPKEKPKVQLELELVRTTRPLGGGGRWDASLFTSKMCKIVLIQNKKCMFLSHFDYFISDSTLSSRKI